MDAHVASDDFGAEAALFRHENKDLLRFIACGSVDHGKSSLLGRLLYEAKLVHDDQIETLRRDSRRNGNAGDELDFSLLFDGLAAEREQKITIDLAYRFFATEKRKFIVADAPGHEQYTRNMATGASTADLALILVNAQGGLTQQTRRHALIVSTFGVRDIIVAVNKMDLVGWSEKVFAAIERDFRAFAGRLGHPSITFIPTSARGGDNVVSRSTHMDWYKGPTLLEELETVDVAPRGTQGFRMPVQWVNRPTAEFRGYCGLIAGGNVRRGMEVRVQPSGQPARIERIVTAAGELDNASAGQSVTLTLSEDVDVSRGDIIAEATAPAMVSDCINARIFWMGQGPLAAGGRYHIKLGTAGAAVTVVDAPRRIDLSGAGESVAAQCLLTNEFGLCRLQIDRALAADRYADNRETGSFILIDPESHDTAAMGLVEGDAAGATAASSEAGLLRPFAKRLLRLFGKRESHTRSVIKAISWRSTGSLDTFFISFLITGNPTIAGSIAVTEIATKILLYYFHERIWALVPWGQR